MEMSPEAMKPAKEELVNSMIDMLPIFLVLIILGIVAALLNLPLLYTLIASKKLREDSKVCSSLRYCSIAFAFLPLFQLLVGFKLVQKWLRYETVDFKAKYV